MSQGATTDANRYTLAKKRPRGYREGQKRFQCTVASCEKTFARLEHLKRHQSTAHDPNHFRYNCSVCGSQFSRQDILKRHQLRRHGQAFDDDFRRPPPAASNGYSDIGNGYMNRREGQIPLHEIEGKVQDCVAALADWKVDKPHDFDAVINANQEKAYKGSLEFSGRLLGMALANGRAPRSLGNHVSLLQTDSRQLARLTVWDESRVLVEMAPAAPASVRSVLVEMVGASEAVEMITPSALREILGLYWSRFHPRWPVLHRTTFCINKTPAYLILAIFSIGCYFSKRPEMIALARKIHESLRFRIYMQKDFKPPTSVWVYQTLLLIEIFQLQVSSESQHEMALQFRHVLVAAMRRSVLGPNRQQESVPKSLQSEWEDFIAEESLRRLAYGVFLLDTQACMLFGQKPLVYVSDLPHDLMSEEAAWEAENAESWRLSRTGVGTHTLKVALMSYLRRDGDIPLSPWNMLTVLYTLFAIALYSEHCRGIFANSVSSTDSESATGEPLRSPPRGVPWRPLISQALTSWLDSFRAIYVTSGCFSQDHPFVVDTLAVYEMSQINLYSDQELIKMFVSSLAEPTRFKSHERHKMFTDIAQWVQSPKSAVALVHCLDLLDLCFSNQLSNLEVHQESAFSRSWCLYLVSVTVWVYDFAVTVLSRSEYFESRPLTTSEYLGRLRAMLPSTQEADSPVSTEVFTDKIEDTIDYSRYVRACDANVLLHTVATLLEKSEWGILQRRLQLIRRILDIKVE